MKKFLLTLIVTMLTCLGAWAQELIPLTETSEEKPLVLNVGETKTITFDFGTKWNGKPLKVSGANTSCSATGPNWNFPMVSYDLKGLAEGTAKIVFEIPEYDGSPNLLAKGEVFVKVADLSLAEAITYSPNPVNIVAGSTTEVYISTTPAEAIKSFQDNYTQSVGNISVQSFNKNTGKVVFAASSDATTGETGTFTFNAKSGSTKESINITVTVADPVDATGITLKVGGEAVTSATTYTLEKNQTLNVLAEVTPEDATNRGFYWSSYDSNVINLYNGTVTAVGHGSTTLQATSNEGGFTTPVLTFNVTEPITNATTTIEVPTTTRVGVTGAKAVVKVNDAVAGSDFGITYTSSNEGVVKVNAAGELEFVGAGNATITATLNPAASTFYTGTTSVTSANINVGAEITCNGWTGSIEKTEFQFGELLSQAENYPQITGWSETVTNGETRYVVTSDNENVVVASFLSNPTKLSIQGLSSGTANVSITAQYGTPRWDGSTWVFDVAATSTFGPIAITVAPFDVSLSVDPAENSVIDINDAVGETRIFSFTNTDGVAALTKEIFVTGDDAAVLNTPTWTDDAKTQLKITPSKSGLGTATVIVRATWAKYGSTAKEVKEVSFNVTVDDKTLVKALIAPTDQDVQQGKDNEISVLFAPATTALFDAPTVENNEANVEVAYATDGGKTDYSTLVVRVPDDASLIGKTATIVLHPKTSSSLTEPVSFVVTVTKKELPVTDVKPQEVLHVGELYTNTLQIIPDIIAEIGDDYTANYEILEQKNSKNLDVIDLYDNGDFKGLHVGTAKIRVTFAPKPGTEAANLYNPWTRDMEITVIPGEMALSLSVTKDVFEVGTGGTTQLTCEVETADYEGDPLTEFTLNFRAEDIKEGIGLGTPDGIHWDITVDKDEAPAQQFALIVDLVPNEGYEDDYKSTTAKIGILVKDPSAKVIVSVDEAGVYTVHVPSPGAFGAIDDNPTVTLENGATLDGLKNAESVKVTGLLSISDMQELNRLIGDAGSVTANVCKSLDMGEAQLTEEVKLDVKNNSGETRINFIHEGDFWSHRMLYVENMVLPKPSPSYTTIPEGMDGWFGGNTSSLKSLTIPEGWTVAAKNCFSPDAANGALVAANSLTLPSTLTYIGENAFAGIKAPVIMIPPLVTYIGDGAFSSADPCDVADVYFTGHAPTYVGQRAFSTAQQMGNNTTNNTVVADDGRTDRNFLVLSGKNVCLMHYPAEYEDEYIDKSRNYTATDRFGKGIKDFNTPYDGGWTSAQLKEINAARVLAREDNNMLLAFDFSNAMDPGYRDLTVSDRVWPSQQLMTAAYTMAWIGYHWDGTPMTQAELDKRGLYQFITTMSDAPDHPSDWEFEGYEADKWYTINLPFDMSVEQIKKVFGAETQVCRFSKVTREVGDNPEDNKLIFEFRNSVMTADALDGDGNPSTGNLSTYHHVTTGLANKEPDYRGQTGIVHGTPYMIKPKGTTDCPIVGEGHQIKRTFEGYVMIGEANNIETITATDGSSVYSFAGTRRMTPLLAGTYFLGRKSVTSRHQYFFYLGGGKQRTPYTAALFAADGGSEDGRVFFDVTIDPTTPDLDDDGSDEPSTTHAAPVNLISLFGDDEGVNTIENFTIVCGDDKMPDNKVYNINGQLINGKNLPAGLYIKNGKKFIVK